MALPIYSMQIIKEITDSIKLNDPNKRYRMISLGYPDIIANKDTLNRIFGYDVCQNVKYHSDSASIIKWHNASDITDGIPNADEVFNELGFDLDIIDIVKARGDERIVDLNTPLPDDLKEQYKHYDPLAIALKMLELIYKHISNSIGIIIYLNCRSPP